MHIAYRKPASYRPFSIVTEFSPPILESTENSSSMTFVIGRINVVGGGEALKSTEYAIELNKYNLIYE